VRVSYWTADGTLWSNQAQQNGRNPPLCISLVDRDHYHVPHHQKAVGNCRCAAAWKISTISGCQQAKKWSQNATL
jgi:hypothetical protein